VDLANIMERLEILEETLRELRTLPGRMDRLEGQVLQLDRRLEAGISAIRTEMRALDEETREQLTAEMRALDQATREQLTAEMRALNEATREQLTAEMRALNEETWRHARVLHEDLVERIKTLGEAFPGRRRRPSR
jgi:predicted component of type VI protein secretion system